MSTDATLTSKRQIAIPKEIRDSLRMKAADRMTFTLLPNGTMLMRVENKSAGDVAGRLHKKGRAVVHNRPTLQAKWAEYSEEESL
jgi:antitoxin PrlF